jgi:hypothetical protein
VLWGFGEVVCVRRKTMKGREVEMRVRRRRGRRRNAR